MIPKRTVELTCTNCLAVWERVAQRGRVPTKCDACRIAAQPQTTRTKRVKDKDRVAKLEASLMASNLHISQHRTDFD